VRHQSDDKREATRELLAFAVAPLGAVLCLLVLFSLWDPTGSGRVYSIRETLSGGIELLLIVLPVAYLTEMLLGAPAHYALQRHGRSRLLDYLLTGAAIGPAPFPTFVLFMLVSTLRRSRSAKLADVVGGLRFGFAWAAIGIPCGIASAAVFWLICVRPQRKALGPQSDAQGFSA
jgi:hypothetical protein